MKRPLKGAALALALLAPILASTTPASGQTASPAQQPAVPSVICSQSVPDGYNVIHVTNGQATGTSGNDVIYGTSGADIINGGAGNDIIIGYAGNDTINGGLGADILIGNNGHDTIDGSWGPDTICGGNGNDIMVGGHGNDSIDGHYGTDNIDGGQHQDIITGGHDNDTIVGGYGQDQLFGEDGADTITGSDGNDIIVGGPGNDQLAGSKHENSMWGSNGHDIINGGTGHDIISGGYGNDVIDGNVGWDTIYGDDGDDTLNGNNGFDTIYGGDGVDVADGGAHDDECQAETMTTCETELGNILQDLESPIAPFNATTDRTSVTAEEFVETCAVLETGVPIISSGASFDGIFDWGEGRRADENAYTVENQIFGYVWVPDGWEAVTTGHIEILETTSGIAGKSNFDTTAIGGGGITMGGVPVTGGDMEWVGPEEGLRIEFNNSVNTQGLKGISSQNTAAGRYQIIGHGYYRNTPSSVDYAIDISVRPQAGSNSPWIAEPCRIWQASDPVIYGEFAEQIILSVEDITGGVVAILPGANCIDSLLAFEDPDRQGDYSASLAACAEDYVTSAAGELDPGASIVASTTYSGSVFEAVMTGIPQGFWDDLQDEVESS